MNIECIIIGIYRKMAHEYGWSLRDMDEANIETLFDFLLMTEPANDNVRTFGGKIYTRAEPGKAPAWL